MVSTMAKMARMAKMATMEEEAGKLIAAQRARSSLAL